MQINNSILTHNSLKVFCADFNSSVYQTECHLMLIISTWPDISRSFLMFSWRSCRLSSLCLIFQVWADAHVLAVQPQNASVLPGDHQQPQGRPGGGLQGDELLLQRGEQTSRHGRAGHGECGNHGERSSGAVLQPAAPRPLFSLPSTVLPCAPVLRHSGRPVVTAFLPQLPGQAPAPRVCGKRALHASPEPVWRVPALRSHERGA